MKNNRQVRREVKLLIKRCTPKTSSWHKLLCTLYKKDIYHRVNTFSNKWNTRHIGKVAKVSKRNVQVNLRTRKHKLGNRGSRLSFVKCDFLDNVW